MNPEKNDSLQIHRKPPASDLTETEKSVKPAKPPQSIEPTADQLARHGLQLRRYLFGLCGSWELAEDLTQQTLLRAWSARKSFDGRSSVRTWLFVIARNGFRDHLRRKQTRPEPETMTPETLQIAENRPSPARRAGLSEFQAAAADAIAQLPDEQRQALALRQSGALSFPEIAEVLGVPVATAKSRVRYALLKLADLLAAYRQELES